MYSGWKGKLRNRKKCQLAAFLLRFVGEPMAKQSQQRNGGLALAAQLVDGPIWSTSVFRRDLHRISLCQYKASSLCCNKSCHHTLPPSKLHRLVTYNGNYHSEVVELQRQFLALRRAGALPLQAWLERRGLGSCALPTHRELPFVYNWGVRSTPLFYQIKSLCNCTSAAPEPLVPQSKRSTEVHSCNGVSQRAFIKWRGWLNISDMLSARSVDFRREVKS